LIPQALARGECSAGNPVYARLHNPPTGYKPWFVLPRVDAASCCAYSGAVVEREEVVMKDVCFTTLRLDAVLS